LDQIKNKIILISPIDWGMGHATRCIPIIKKLKQSNTVIIGTTALNQEFFNLEFPNLQKIMLPSYNIVYSQWLPVWFKILLQFMKINSVIRQEKKIINQVINDHKIELIISDNRFGLVNRKINCIVITHQTSIVSPFFPFFINKINRYFLSRFNEVWIPDYQNKNHCLSGSLSSSDNLKLKIKHIGPQSSLKDLEVDEKSKTKFDALILLSGVEPQRSILEQRLIENLKNSSKKIALVRGSNNFFDQFKSNLTVYNFAYGSILKDLIINSELVICRSGYSTLMDLHFLQKKKIILIPTPGQTEQEYLAKYWQYKFSARTCTQSEIKSFDFF
jgi:uncharacterized protein (TIGR00661 family)